jgi:hypothetical protein
MPATGFAHDRSGLAPRSATTAMPALPDLLLPAKILTPTTGPRLMIIAKNAQLSHAKRIESELVLTLCRSSGRVGARPGGFVRTDAAQG